LKKMINKILKNLDSNNLTKKSEALGTLSDHLELSSSLAPEIVKQAVVKLLPLAIKEKNLELKELIMHNLVLCYQSGDDIDIPLDELTQIMDKLPHDLLEYALTILSFSGNTLYINKIIQYLNHNNPNIKKTARDALNLLNATKIP